MVRRVGPGRDRRALEGRVEVGRTAPDEAAAAVVDVGPREASPLPPGLSLVALEADAPHLPEGLFPHTHASARVPLGPFGPTLAPSVVSRSLSLP